MFLSLDGTLQGTSTQSVPRALICFEAMAQEFERWERCSSSVFLVA